MNNYEFTLILDEIDLTHPQYEDAFFDAGCDDAILSIKDQTPYITFDREAKSAELAICGAIRDVEKTGAKVLSINEAGPVTMSEAATMADVSKALLGMYSVGKRGAGGFPAPVHVGKTTIWMWIAIARWLNASGKLSQQKMDVAEYANEGVSLN